MKPEETCLSQLGVQSPRTGSGWRTRLKQILSAPSPCLNTGTRLGWLLAYLDSSACILDLGSGNHRLRAGVMNLEIAPFPNVDVVGDAAQLPFDDACFDAVICQAVLEHVRDPLAVVAEIARVLRPGGYVYVEIPFLQGFHADPLDYQRYTRAGIEYLFRSFRREDSGVCVGPSSTMAWVLREYVSLIVGRGRTRVVARHLFGWLTFLVKYFDFVLARHPEAHVIASGFYWLGRRAG